MSNQNKPILRKPRVKAVPMRASKPRTSKPRGNGRGRRSAMVGLAPNATNPRTKQRMSSSSDGHSCRFRGTDFVQSVSSGTGLVAGQVLISLPANPRMIGVSRLAIASSVWERFKFRSLKFHYAPIANATQTGSLIGYVDYDVNDAPVGTGDANLQRAFAHYGSQSCQIWGDPSKRTTWELKDIDPLTDLYIDSPSEDPHWTSQGRFILLAASTVATSLPLGNVFVEYDVEFFIPQIEVTPVSGSGAKITGSASMSQSNYLGTPVNSTWNNIDVGYAANVFSLPAGSYLISIYRAGTVFNAHTFTTTGTSVVGSLLTNAAATESDQWAQLTSTVPFTFTLTGTATTVTACIVMIALLPTSALTMVSKLQAKLSAFTAMASDLVLLRDALKQAALTDSSSTVGPSSLGPVPLTPCNTSQSSSSTSSSTSGSWFRV